MQTEPDPPFRAWWWWVSATLHAGLAGVLLYFAFPQFLASEQPENATVRVAQDIQETQSVTARTRLEKVLAEERKLDDTLAQKDGEYRDQVKVFEENLPEMAATDQAGVREWQERALQAQLEVMDSLESKDEANSASGDLGEKISGLSHVLDQIRIAQTAAEERQNEALGHLAFGGEEFASGRQKQREALLSQQTASLEQIAAASLLATMERTTADLATARDRKALTATQLAEIQAAGAAASVVAAELDATWQADKASADQAVRAKLDAMKLAGSRDPADRAAFTALDAEARKLGTKERAARDALAKASRAADTNQREKSKNTELEKLNHSISEKSLALNTAISSLKATQKNAAIKQVEAAATQEMMAGALPAESFPRTGEYVGLALPDPAPADTQHLTGLDEIYEAAVQSEARSGEKARRLLATEMSIRRKIPLEEMISQSQSLPTQRPGFPLDANQATDALSLSAYRGAVGEMLGQMQSMANSSTQHVGGIPGNLLAPRTRGAEQMHALALASNQFPGMDLTGGVGDTTVAEEGGAFQNIGRSRRVHGLPRNSPELPSLDYKKARKLAAQRVGTDGAPGAAWFFPDGWWIIGPFPNPNRTALSTSFPPEKLVDLSAVYSGKDGRPVHWEYLQFPTPRVTRAQWLEETPAIYYAYTEIVMDTDRDLWLATGSDDKGVLWVNGQLVWVSGDMLKGWIPNEGYRKIRFVAGTNRLLYRLENGWLRADFSVMISTRIQPTKVP